MADEGESSREGIEEEIRATERSRIRALLAGDMDAANRLHANDFQLVSPRGVAYSREDYLGYVASGEISYQKWEVDSEIAIRLHGDMAAIRYRSQMERIAHGQRYAGRFWHTNTLEKKDGQWQVVWTQLTQIPVQ
ncbi:MAG TPA: nuclear transport factor 2 family protein [Ktedonobacteraceae bacterium]|nr:nuclear transport factor 2 family protein [Ktedonobacteraceae bacterium]